MENFFRFTFKSGQAICDGGKTVQFNKDIELDLEEGVEYRVKDPGGWEYKDSTAINFCAKILRSDEVEVVYKSHRFWLHATNLAKAQVEIIFSMKRMVLYQNELFYSGMDSENFSFGLKGNEEFYSLLPEESRKLVDDFRSYMEWVNHKQLVILDPTEDYNQKQAYSLFSKEKTVEVREHYGEVYAIETPELIYHRFFQCDDKVGEPENIKVQETSRTMSLEESGIPFSFRPIWKSPTQAVGLLTVNGQEIKGIVHRPGDGTGSYLDAIVYMGLAQRPPDTLSDSHIEWLESGGKICWVYSLSSGNRTIEDLLRNSLKTQPDNANGWVKVVAVYVTGGYASACYIQDDFEHEDYNQLVRDSQTRSLTSYF